MGRKKEENVKLSVRIMLQSTQFEKRKQTLIAVGVLGVIAVIVGYAGFLFMNMTVEAPGGPENAGALGSDHAHAAILVKIFGDEFDFSAPAYQIKSPWIHFESRDGSTIHKHATGVELEYLFNSLNIGIDDQCFIFPDGKQFCTNDEYSLKYFINGEKVTDIRSYEIMEDDRILITFGGETDDQVQEYLKQVGNQEIIK